MGVKLFVGNLPYSATEEEIRAKFAAVGEVLSVKIIMDRQTGRPRGFCFVEMVDQAAAEAAIAALNGQEFGGRQMVVNLARPEERNNRPM